MSGAVTIGNNARQRRTLAVAIALVLGGCAQERAEPPPTPPAQLSLQEIMLQKMDPSVDPLWEAVGTVETRTGIESRVPTTEAQWDELRKHAQRLVEIGDLLQMPGRSAVPPGSAVPGSHIDGVLDHAAIEAEVAREWPRFVKYAQDFQSAASEALAATQARDAARLLVVGEQLQQACEQCHAHFWYPGDRPPPDPAASDVVPLE